MPVHAFDVLGDPVRRRILELLADGERSAGRGGRRRPRRVRDLPARGVPAPAGAARGGLRDGPARRRPAAVRREPGAAARVDAWLDRFRRFWTPHLDALETELARGRRAAASRAPEAETRVIDVSPSTSAPCSRRSAAGVPDGQARVVTVVTQRYRRPRRRRLGRLHEPRRIPRWFLPITGELRLGGRYQLEGNAGGVVERATRRRRGRAGLRRHLGVRRQVSGIEVRLTPGPDGATVLTWTTSGTSTTRWAEFGPGAVGVGWELGLLGLAGYLGAAGVPTPDRGCRVVGVGGGPPVRGGRAASAVGCRARRVGRRFGGGAGGRRPHDHGRLPGGAGGGVPDPGAVIPGAPRSAPRCRLRSTLRWVRPRGGRAERPRGPREVGRTGSTGARVPAGAAGPARGGRGPRRRLPRLVRPGVRRRRRLLPDLGLPADRPAGPCRGRGPLELARRWSRTLVRLLPCAVVVLVATVVAGALLLPEGRWPQTLREVVAAALFLENWRLAADTVDYAARSAMSSAGAALLVAVDPGAVLPGLAAARRPVVLAARGRRGAARGRLLVVVLGVIAASLTFSVVLTATHQALAYVHSLTRLWEFALGGLLALTIDTVRLGAATRVRLGWVGLAGLVTCGAVLRGSAVFPGFAALWPTGCAVLVLLAGTHRGAQRGGPAARVAPAAPPRRPELPALPVALAGARVRPGARGSRSAGRRRRRRGRRARRCSSPSRPTTSSSEPVRARRRRRGAAGSPWASPPCSSPPGCGRGDVLRRAQGDGQVGDVRHPGALALVAGAPGPAPLLPPPVAVTEDWVRIEHWDCAPMARFPMDVCAQPVAAPQRRIVVVGDSHTQQLAGALVPIAARHHWQLIAIDPGRLPVLHGVGGRPRRASTAWTGTRPRPRRSPTCARTPWSPWAAGTCGPA